METIVKQVAERAGIPEDRAQKAVEVVISQLMERLPPPLAAQLGAYVQAPGAPDVGGSVEVKDAVRGIKDLFGAE